MLAKLLAAHKAGQLQVLRRARSPRRAQGVHGVSGAAAQARMVRLRKASVRRTQRGARLSVALYPPRRHLQPPADRIQRQRRHLQVQGLSRRRPCALQAHDARQSTSSSAASSSTSCRRASIASATTDCSPKRPLRTTSRARASCSRCQSLKQNPQTSAAIDDTEPACRSRPCPCCGGRMIIIETFARGCEPHYQPSTTTVAYQDRYIMTAITGLRRRRVDLASCWSATGSECARLKRRDRRRNRPRNNRPQRPSPPIEPSVLLPTSHVIARDQTHRAPLHAPSALAKSP